MIFIKKGDYFWTYYGRKNMELLKKMPIVVVEYIRKAHLAISRKKYDKIKGKKSISVVAHLK